MATVPTSLAAAAASALVMAVALYSTRAHEPRTERAVRTATETGMEDNSPISTNWFVVPKNCDATYLYEPNSLSNDMI